MNSSAKNPIPILPLLVVNFINSLGFSIVIPFLVFLVDDFGGNGIVYGIILASYPAFQLIGAPVLGNWSDRYGRRKVLGLSQVGTLFSWLVFMGAFYFEDKTLLIFDSELIGEIIITIPLLILFFARMFDGLTGGNISVANAYLADISNESTRKQNFGKMSAASGIGFIVGPALAGIIGGTVYGYILPVLAAAFISLIGVLLIYFWLPELAKSQSNHEENTKNGIPWKSILTLPHIPLLLGLYFLIYLGFNFFYPAFPIHAMDVFQWDVGEVGLFFAYLSLMMALVQAVVLPRISNRFSEVKLILAGSVILGLNFVILAYGKAGHAYIAAILFALGNGVMWPSFLALLAQNAGQRHQGVIQGLGNSFGSLASILGLITAGFLYDIVQGKTFLVAAFIIFLVFLLSFKLGKPAGTRVK